MEIRISVRRLVEFILRSGDIDNRRHSGSDTAMLEGGRIHRMIQRRAGADYKAEVSLRFLFAAPDYDLTVEGRADGIIEGEIVTIDEIKGTYRDVDRMKEPVGVHLAQAKCYAFMYAAENGRCPMKVRMTYVNMDTEEVQYFISHYTFEELEQWFLGVIAEYRKWSDFTAEWNRLRTESAKACTFPYAYRPGQKELAGGVYQTIRQQKKLFIEAPTGVGKTLSTLFPAVKALGEGEADRIFYLTAKTITRQAADNAVELLRGQGLRMKTVELTAKDKICFNGETECNPAACPYARGHYDRVNAAMYDLLIHEDHYDRGIIEEYAKRYEVCPFEMCLDMSLFADTVICDYNYVFDPHAYLRRFFGEGAEQASSRNIFLIDEAHNLVERGREMYSASLIKEDFLELKHLIKPYDNKMASQADRCSRELLVMKRRCEGLTVEDYADEFVRACERLYETMEKYLEDHEDSPVRMEVLDFYFELSHFLTIYEQLEEDYVIYTQLKENGDFMIRLFCVDPARNLKLCMQRAKASILFSATLLPIQYYKKLLGGEETDYEMYAKSSFDPEKCGLFIGRDVTSRYTRRNREEYHRIASYIREITQKKQGNYMVFFPSYSFLEEVRQVYETEFMDPDREELLIQEEFMSEEDRERFLDRFAGSGEVDLGAAIHMEIVEEESRTLIGFCIMGGIFSEGIDLKNDQLIGALIVGTGLPQVCPERELLKAYFDEMGQDGFNYAYRFPGMNKVLQAAGRVIRTAQDVGVVALLDDRFLNGAHTRLFPREWKNVQTGTVDTIGERVKMFWNGHTDCG